MDLSKLNSNEKIAGIGAVLAIVGSVISFGAGPYGVLTGIAMLVIIFLPQFSPATKLPGSKGSLMLIVGGAAAIGALLTLLAWLPYLGIMGSFFIGGILGIVGGLLMGWGAWQEFQAEGGKFQLGTAPSSAGTATGGTVPPPATDTSRDQAAAPAPERTADSAVDTTPAADAPRPGDYRDEDRPTS
jgi:hypothetical protein